MKKFDISGYIEVKDNTVGVILFSIRDDGSPVRYILEGIEPEHTLDFDGNALLAIDTGSGLLGELEMGSTMIVEHPDVKRILGKAIDGMRLLM